MLSSDEVNRSEGRNEAQNNHISAIIPIVQYCFYLEPFYLTYCQLFPYIKS